MELAQDHTRGWFENLKEKLGFYGSYYGEDGKRHSNRTQKHLQEAESSDDDSLVEVQYYQGSIEHSSDDESVELQDDLVDIKHSSNKNKSSQNLSNGKPPPVPPKKIIKPGQEGYREYQLYLASQEGSRL